jgi:hypothetical protein
MGDLRIAWQNELSTVDYHNLMLDRLADCRLSQPNAR